MVARHREAGRLRLGTPGRWGKAQQLWGVRPESSFVHQQLSSTKSVAHGTVRLGSLGPLIHWTKQRKEGRQDSDNHPPVPVPRPLGGFQMDSWLHVTVGPGAPNIWKWHLVWKKGPTTTALLHSTLSVAKQEPSVHQNRKKRCLTMEAAEAYPICTIPPRRPEGTNQQGLEFKEVLRKDQEGTFKETPEVIKLECLLLKEALQMRKENTSQECLPTTKLESTFIAEALLVGQAHTSQEFPSTTQLLAIFRPAPESTMPNKSLKMKHEGTCQQRPTYVTLAALLLENKYVMWKIYPYQQVATLVKYAIQRQEGIHQEAAEASQVKKDELPDHDVTIQKTLVTAKQADDLEIRKPRQPQQQCQRQQPWGR